MGGTCTKFTNNAEGIDHKSDISSSTLDESLSVIGEDHNSRFSKLSAKWRKYIGNEVEVAKSNQEESSMIDSGLAQLWEDCFDLSELMEVTGKKVAKHIKDFWNHGYKGIETNGEDEQKALGYLSNISDELDTTSLDDVVNKLRVAVFSRKSLVDEKAGEPETAMYLTVVKQVQENLVKTVNKSFDLFILSVRICQRTNVDYHIQRSTWIWNKVFKMYNQLNSIIRRLKELAAPAMKIKYENPSLERVNSFSADQGVMTKGCEKDILIMLNSMVRFVRWKQVTSPAGIADLVENVQCLRLELTKVTNQVRRDHRGNYGGGESCKLRLDDGKPSALKPFRLSKSYKLLDF